MLLFALLCQLTIVAFDWSMKSLPGEQYVLSETTLNRGMHWSPPSRIVARRGKRAIHTALVL